MTDSTMWNSIADIHLLNKSGKTSQCDEFKALGPLRAQVHSHQL
jgi:hypothetical protein